MFDDKKSVLRDRPGQHRYARKELPYTIKEINEPIEAYRARARELDRQSELKRQTRFNDVVYRLQHSMDSGSEITQSDEINTRINNESETTRVRRRHLDIERQNRAAAIAAIEARQNRDIILQSEARIAAKRSAKLLIPWHTRLWNSFLEKFLTFDFNR